MEGFECIAEKLDFFFSRCRNPMKEECHDGSLGSGKMYYSSQYGDFVGGVRKRLKGSQPDKEHGHRSGVLKTRRRAVEAESKILIAVCFFILTYSLMALVSGTVSLRLRAVG